MKDLLIAISGGRSSAMMAYTIINSDKYKGYNKLFVFANTGMERVETIDFLKNIQNHWGVSINVVEAVGSNIMGVGISYKLTTLEDLNMNCKPFEEVIKHKNKNTNVGLPSMYSPYCSEGLKTIPSRKFAKDVFGHTKFLTAVGFRAEDMPKRISWAEIKEDKKRIFPLITDFEYPAGLRDLDEFWNEQPFKLGINSSLGNCDLCWKKSDKRLVEVIKSGAARSVEWWKKMGSIYEDSSFRGSRSIIDLFELAKNDKQGVLFDVDNLDDDGCVCSF